MSPDEGKRAYRREMLLATALVAVGLAIIVAIFRRRRAATADDLRTLEG